MKKTILFIGVLIFSLNCLSQNQRATLYLRNGDTIQGLAKFTISGLKFRYNKQSTKEKYDSKKLIKIDINEQGKTNTYIYKLIKGSKYSAIPSLMTLITQGKINLYRVNVSGMTAPTTMGFVGTGGMGIGMGTSFSIDNYYVCKDKSDIVTRLTSIGSLFSNKKFIKAASKYFSDCPNLVNQIKNKVYQENDIEEIVKFYNTKCN